MLSISSIIDAQVVEEIVQLDTTFEKINVVYRPTYTTSASYQKKVGVFRSDTSQVAIEKTYLREKLNGIYKVYYPGGRLMVKAVFANGKPNGEFTWWDSKGIIRIKGMYKDSIKHGFWAYKYLKIYGKYKNGKKHKRWYQLDANNQKQKSWYKNGKLIKGDGFGDDKVKQLNENLSPKDSVVVIQPSVKDTIEQEVVFANAVQDEYLQAIDFLKNNFIFRKTIKEHFGKGFNNLRLFKKNYTHNIFQFKIAHKSPALGMDNFIEKSKNGKIEAVRIDSLIKAELEMMQKLFKTETENKALSSHSSKSKSNITVFFSPIENGLMRIDVLWNKDEKEFENDQVLYESLAGEGQLDFKILLFFNQNGKLAAAEYQ